MRKASFLIFAVACAITMLSVVFDPTSDKRLGYLAMILFYICVDLAERSN